MYVLRFDKWRGINYVIPCHFTTLWKLVNRMYIIKTNLIREFKQLFSRKEFYLCLTACLLISIIDFLLNMPSSSRFFYNELPSAFQNCMMFNSSIGQIIILFFIPCLASVSYADSYFCERHNGLLVAIRSRISARKYLFSKLFVVAISSLFFVTFPFLLNQLFSFIAYPLASNSNIFHRNAYDAYLLEELEGCLFPLLHMNQPFANNLMHMFNVGIWAINMGMLTFGISLYVQKNKTIVLLSTTIISLFFYVVFSILGLRSGIMYLYLFAAPEVGGRIIIHFYVANLFLLIMNLLLPIFKMKSGVL